MKIIQIDGIKGLISAVVMAICLFAGFIIFPGQIAMALWNKYLVTNYMFPKLDLFQGILLWAIIAIIYFILTSDGFAISFKNSPSLSDEELNKIIKSAKIGSQMKLMNTAMTKADRFELSSSKENPFELPKEDNNSQTDNSFEEEEKKCSDNKK